LAGGLPDRVSPGSDLDDHCHLCGSAALLLLLTVKGLNPFDYASRACEDPDRWAARDVLSALLGILAIAICCFGMWFLYFLDHMVF
jgi:hypothetical protein